MRAWRFQAVVLYRIPRGHCALVHVACAMELTFLLVPWKILASIEWPQKCFVEERA